MSKYGTLKSGGGLATAPKNENKHKVCCLLLSTYRNISLTVNDNRINITN